MYFCKYHLKVFKINKSDTGVFFEAKNDSPSSDSTLKISGHLASSSIEIFHFEDKFATLNGSEVSLFSLKSAKLGMIFFLEVYNN